MSHRLFTFGIFVAAIFAWAAWGVVIVRLSPFTQAGVALSLFYASFFIALTATLTLLNYYSRLSFRKIPLKKSPLNIALRQGFLISLMITFGLIFQRLRVLTWWNGLLLVLIVLLAEFYFASKD